MDVYAQKLALKDKDGGVKGSFGGNFNFADRTTVVARLKLCRLCKDYKFGVCALCGCLVRVKSKFQIAVCRLGSGEDKMSMYAKVLGSSVLKYPYTFDDLQSENVYTKFPDPTDLPTLYVGTEDQIATGAEIVRVENAPVPICDSNTQRLVPHTLPHFDGNSWVISYDVEALPQEQVSANVSAIGAVIQAKIDAVLAETAWTVQPNSGLEANKVSEWVAYRTALGQVPQQSGFPMSYKLPVKPE